MISTWSPHAVVYVIVYVVSSRIRSQLDVGSSARAPLAHSLMWTPPKWQVASSASGGRRLKASAYDPVAACSGRRGTDGPGECQIGATPRGANCVRCRWWCRVLVVSSRGQPLPKANDVTVM